MNGKIDVVITDDHKLFRKGIAALLSDFEFIGSHREYSGRDITGSQHARNGWN